MSIEEENKAIHRRVYEEIWNKGNLALIDELIADEYMFHRAGAPKGKGPEWYKGAYHFLLSAFPDIHCIIEDMIAEGDKVMTRTTLTATHKGDYMGVDPTGKKISVTEIDVVRFIDGKLVDEWGGIDRFELMQQLGAIPTQ